MHSAHSQDYYEPIRQDHSRSYPGSLSSEVVDSFIDSSSDTSGGIDIGSGLDLSNTYFSSLDSYSGRYQRGHTSFTSSSNNLFNENLQFQLEQARRTIWEKDNEIWHLKYELKKSV
jgi:hypothetical protein